MKALPLLLFFCCSVLSEELFCSSIDNEFRRIASVNNKTVACRCQENGFYYNVKGATIECSDSSMPSLQPSLAMLNDTVVGSVRIWNSAMFSLLKDTLKKVSFEQLSIENCGLGKVEDKAMAHVVDRLTVLSLKGNILNEKILPKLVPLIKLQRLDLSGNQIVSLSKTSFPDELSELFLDNNDLKIIEDGAFANLKKLKKLTLSYNHLTTITKDTFVGLDKLEVLQLQHNQIDNIHPAAFSHLKNLRVIDLGTNEISSVELRALPRLEKIFLNNNNIVSFKSVILKDLPSAVLISMDKNFISELHDSDLVGLARSGRLESLTLSTNNISYIETKAFAPIQHVSILALQNNQIDRLGDENKPSFLAPLQRLQTLLLSHNVIKKIREKDLPRSVKVLAADHNKLEDIDQKAFDGITIQRLYINHNLLNHLERHTFDSFDINTLEAVDITENRWLCVCGKEWLVDWLDEIGEKDAGEGNLGCLVVPGCKMSDSLRKAEEEAEARRSQWISTAATVLALASVVILIFIAYYFITDGAHTRSGSDTKPLIADLNAQMANEIDVTPITKRTSSTEKKRVQFME